MKKVLIVFGTRPEAIKLAPVIIEAKRTGKFEALVCVFRQHKDMLDQVLKTFGIKPDFDLPISVSDKDLFSSSVNPVKKLITLARSGFGFLGFMRILKKEKPDLLMVQGDTSTVFLAAFFGFLARVPIAHVEAGLRTYDKYSPFPEEMNRQLLCRLADIHFAPTETAKQNLLREGVSASKIHLVGNTEIDALLWVLNRYKDPAVAKRLENNLSKDYGVNLESGKKLILVTAHRRESFGEGLKNIFEALKEIASKRKDVLIVFPVHPNPNVQSLAHSMLTGQENIVLTTPVAYEPFAFLMNKSYMILTDSGGIQEAAPSLGKPVLVMREKTERGEGVEAGVSRLVGTNKERIVKAVFELLDNPASYASMTGKKNPYGDGKAAEKIVEVI